MSKQTKKERAKILADLDARTAKIDAANKRLEHVRIFEFDHWYIDQPDMPMGPTMFAVEWLKHPEGERDERGRKRSRRLGDRKTLAGAIDLAERWDASW